MTTTREAALEAALNGCIAAIEHADMADGVCCCGDNMDNHSEPMNCGHSPVDAGEYHAHQVLTAARAALSTPATEPQGLVENDTIDSFCLTLRRLVSDAYAERDRFGHIAATIHVNALHHGATNAEVEAMLSGEISFVNWIADKVEARPAPQPAAAEGRAMKLVINEARFLEAIDRAGDHEVGVGQPAAEHEYPDPLIAEDRYEDDQPAADTRVVSLEDLKNWRDRCAGALPKVADEIRAIIGTATPAQTYQSRVKPWLDACFGPEIAGDKTERNHRFLEEALELVQSGGCTASEAHQLVDYVYGRPVGEMGQEIGGVMNTLAALCLAYGRDMHEDGETELARVWTKVEKIRAKQAAKPKHSPLPEHTPAPSDKIAEAAIDRCMQEIEDIICEADVSYPAGRDAGTSIDFDRDAVLAALRALAGKGE